MQGTLRICLAQMTSTNAHEGNIAFVADAAARAAEAGCDMLCLPEVAGLMNRDFAVARGQVVDAADDPYIAACRNLAARHGIWIETGSTPVRGTAGKFRNHGDLIDAQGDIVASYDKIHLFDVFLDGKPPTGESQRFEPGERAVLADSPWGPLGLSICYDLRFAQLYRDYALAGASVLFIPAAFTVPTGQAHWEVLLRARAIETGAFVVAAAQVGTHDDGRSTWGHAMVVDPWGAILADLGGDAPGLAMVDLPLDRIAAARRQIPSLRHGRGYDLVTARRPGSGAAPAGV